jgi:hypothetical protein
VGLIMRTTFCAGGLFSATLDVRALSDSAMVTVRAAQTTAAGTGSDTRVVRKDATAPSGTAVTTPTSGTVTTDNTPQISGSAEPGATVTVFVNGNVVGTAVANSSGVWTFIPPTPMADGSYLVTVSAKDQAGNEGALVMGPSFTIDSIAPAAPVIITPAGNAEIDVDRMMEITGGGAEPGASVTVYIDGRAVGMATADSTGHFSVRVDPATIGQGPHTVEADDRDAAGNTSPRSAQVQFSIRAVDARFAGQGVIGCSATGGLEFLAMLALFGLRRRRLSFSPGQGEGH